MSDPAATVRRTADSVWAYLLEREPYLRLRNGLPVEHLQTGTLAEAEETAAFAATQLRGLSALEGAALGTEDWLTSRFLVHFLTELTEGPESWWWSFPVTPYGAYGLISSVRQVVAALDLDAPRDAERYVAIAFDFAESVRVMHDKLGRQAERGWRVPRPALMGATTTVTGLRALAEQLFGSRGIDGAEKILSSEIVPAVDALLADLEGYGQQAPEGVGLAQYPGGEDVYRRLVRRHATYDITPEAVHETGLQQVESLTHQLAEVRAQLGFSGTEHDFARRLEAEGRLHAASAEDVEARYRAAIARIEPELGRLFSVVPRAPYDVARLDPELEAGLTYGYYEPPTDATPVGRYRYNGSGLDTRSQLSAAAIIYHELVPGHHFQIARQKENTALPELRRDALSFVAFVEGWAEYAAGLAAETGMYADPYDRYGWLVHQRFVSQRLVVDTGMNALGWPLGRARAYMAEMTFESPAQVATETLRYATDLPGQALGYRLGFLKLRELRDHARRVLGERFDIRDYHELVLAPGALPLSVVEEHLERRLRQD